MKLSAMPASVESSAARGVDLRSRSATGAHASSMTPEANVAKSPACHATRAGSARAGRDRQRLGRQHHEEHVREERDRVDAVGQRADVGPAGALRQPLRLERIGDVPDQDRDRRARQDAPVDQLGGKPEHARGTGRRSAAAERDCRWRGRRSRRCLRERSSAQARSIHQGRLMYAPMIPSLWRRHFNPSTSAPTAARRPRKSARSGATARRSPRPCCSGRPDRRADRPPPSADGSDAVEEYLAANGRRVGAGRGCRPGRPGAVPALRRLRSFGEPSGQLHRLRRLHGVRGGPRPSRPSRRAGDRRQRRQHGAVSPRRSAPRKHPAPPCCCWRRAPASAAPSSMALDWRWRETPLAGTGSRAHAGDRLHLLGRHRAAPPCGCTRTWGCVEVVRRRSRACAYLLATATSTRHPDHQLRDRTA